MVALIVAADLDLTVEAVMSECEDQGVDIVRFDLADYPRDVHLALDDFAGSRALRVRERAVDLDRVTAVWYRRPSNIVGPDDGAWDPVEAAQVMAGALYCARGLWINRPDLDLTAGFKVHQLHLARRLGLRVPRTVVTNDPDVLRRVAADGPDMVFKLLHGALIQPAGRPATVLTTPVTAAHVERAEHIRHSPCLFQEHLPKAHEARVTVVGRTVFPVTIDSQSTDRTTVDWRATRGDSPPYGPYRAPPPDVLDGMLAMMAELGIVYGAFDFVVDEAGGWTFLEVNSMGQYLWLEQDLGIPISAALASLLRRGRPALDDPVRVVGY